MLFQGAQVTKFLVHWSYDYLKVKVTLLLTLPSLLKPFKFWQKSKNFIEPFSTLIGHSKGILKPLKVISMVMKHYKMATIAS